MLHTEQSLTATDNIQLPSTRHNFDDDDVENHITCKICNKLLKNKRTYTKHMKMLHSEQQGHSCLTCGKVFLWKESWKRHVTTVHPNGSLLDTDAQSTVIKCHICKKRFGAHSNLKLHMRCHTGERPHKCDICAKPFAQACDLVAHSRTHTGEKPFVCKFCERSFATSSLRTLHLKTHFGQRDYACGVCGKLFVHRRNRQRHELHHNKKLLFQCTVCGKGFYEKCRLNQHLEMHGAATHKCRYCEKVFRSSKSLPKHEKIHIQKGEVL